MSRIWAEITSSKMKKKKNNSHKSALKYNNYMEKIKRNRKKTMIILSISKINEEMKKKLIKINDKKLIKVFQNVIENKEIKIIEVHEIRKLENHILKI